MTARTISEKILSEKAGRSVRAGDVAICRVDRVLGTDASSPMAIDYFEKMGGTRLFDPSRVLFSFDHYSPPASAKTAAFHDRVRAFAARYGAAVCEVGEGIGFQLLAERGVQVSYETIRRWCAEFAPACARLLAFAGRTAPRADRRGFR